MRRQFVNAQRKRRPGQDESLRMIWGMTFYLLLVTALQVPGCAFPISVCHGCSSPRWSSIMHQCTTLFKTLFSSGRLRSIIINFDLCTCKSTLYVRVIPVRGNSVDRAGASGAAAILVTMATNINYIYNNNIIYSCRVQLPWLQMAARS